MRYVPNFARPALGPIRNFVRGKNSLKRATRVLEHKAANPSNFSEKVFYKMAYDRREILTTFADKVAVHDYVSSRIGSHNLPLRYGIYEELPDKPPADLPPQFVIKASHGSGAVILVWDGAPAGRLPRNINTITWESFSLTPDSLDWSDLRALTKKWMGQNLYWAPGRFPEWAYRDVPPRIIIEELLLDSDGLPSKDYKFFMFDGTCRLIHEDKDRFVDHRRDVYDPQWNLLPFTIKFKNTHQPSQQPTNLAELLGIAEQLSRGMDFIRVDLYNTSEGIKFSELTNYPAGGIQAFHPVSSDIWLGKFWQIPDYTSLNGTREID